MRDDLTLVRFGEISLKGANRPEFERVLRRNIKAALRPFPDTHQEVLRGRVLVHHPGHGPAAREALRKVCGVVSISAVRSAPRDFPAIAEVTREVFEDALRRRPEANSFRIRARRADKRFPLTSLDLERQLGGVVLERHPELRVDLDHAAIEIGVDLRNEGCYVHSDRIEGPGGLPVGSTGRALALLSGGIDSPVAAYLAMTRGLSVQLVFFHSPEYTGTGGAEKVRRLARRLSPYQPFTTLHVVPFGEVQTLVRDRCKESYRTVLYRRAMHRIADRIADEIGAGALVCGDSLAQVASQTLENLQVTAKASTHLLLRPLIAQDKETTMERARALGTYDLSILDEPDCCTLFQPRHPVLRGHVERAEEEEALLGDDSWIDHALAGRTRHSWRSDGSEVERSEDERPA